MSAPTTLLEFCHARKVVGYYPVGAQGTVLGIAVDLSALPCFLRLFHSPYRVGVSGRLVTVGSDLRQSERSCKQGFGASPVGEAGRSRKWCLARPSGRRGRPEAGWRPKGALRSERRARVGSGHRSSSARPFGRGSDRSSDLSFRYLGRPKSLCVVRNVICWSKPFAGKPVHEGPRVYEPDIISPDYF